MKIGVVSDTHGFFDARLEELLADVELILHAGDVGNLEVLDELERIAPVRAVKGNVDSLLAGLPLSLSL
jgi:putative phosphoesterase